MNEHTTIDPETGTDLAHAARIARNKEFWAKIDASRKMPRKGWDTEIDLSPIRHTKRP